MTGCEDLIGREVVVLTMAPEKQILRGARLEAVGAAGVLILIISNGRRAFLPWPTVRAIAARGDNGGEGEGEPADATLRALWGKEGE